MSKKVLLTAMMALAASQSGFTPVARERKRTEAWQRKKCKSCTYFGYSDYCSEINRYRSPKNAACENYKNRK